MSEMIWRYGVRGPVTGESTARGYSMLGCTNMLGHQMKDRLRNDLCECKAFRVGHVDRDIPNDRRCEPCREYLRAHTQLEMARRFELEDAEVVFDGVTFFYRPEA